MKGNTLGPARAHGCIGAAMPAEMAGGSAHARVGRPSMSAARAGVLVGVLTLAGCAGIERAPQRETPQVVAPYGAMVSIEPGVTPTVPPPEPPRTSDPQGGTVAAAPTLTSAAPTVSGTAARSPVKPDASAPNVPARVPAPPAPAAQLPKKEAPAAALAKPEAPSPLDLKSLETRLKETKAIGVFTKLTLKNQVDDLLNQFRAFYQGHLKTSLADLRRSYDLLVLKVLALLQDADPPLASAIAASRESIWGILSNPAKFAAV